ncbi:2-oxoacid:acceptor oxidoreductase family protein [Candidatus Gribaldobacteria bacterium]|nr:2-oxoacid:acceptor oxidoreductase family protein [Candidatus Gribaldobacteria bacterium]
MRNNAFNLIIGGVGGQGLVTLLNLVAEAAFISGFDVKTSELHGLSQRGGSVSVFIRFGKEVFSPIVPYGQADLIIALEEQESLLALNFAFEKTIFLINKFQTPTLTNNLSLKQIENVLQRHKIKYCFLPASEICQKEFQSDVLAGIFLLGYGLGKQFLPLNQENLLLAIERTLPEVYQTTNKKAFLLGIEASRKNLCPFSF